MASARADYYGHLNLTGIANVAGAGPGSGTLVAPCGSLFKFGSWHAGHLALNIFEMRCFLATGITHLLEMQMKARAG
jgi:hypothetical protein